jgi:membrane protein DedA with SNARE-associated domain
MRVIPLLGAVALLVFVAVRREHVSPLVRAIAAVAFAALIAYGSGLVTPPDPDVIVRDTALALGSYTYVLVGALAYLETAGFAGLVAPGELAILLGGVSAGQGATNLVAMVAVVWVCSVAGDLTSYALGRRLGRQFLVRHGAAVGITEERLARVERHFDRHGGKTILIGRSISLVRSVAPFVAGASHMPLRRFVPYTALAAGFWGAVVCLLGYVFSNSLDEVMTFVSRGSIGIVIAVAALAGLWTLYRQMRPAAER